MTDQPTTRNPLDDVSISELLQDATGSTYHPVIRLWREVLGSGRKVSRRITPQWANRIVSNYEEITYDRMPEFRDLYLTRIEEILGILEALIDENPKCFEPASSEEDVQQNSGLYLEVITEWQKRILGWELDWDCINNAALDLATFSEVHRMLFGEQGLASLLDSIGFEFTDMHRDALSLALQEFQMQKEGDGE